MKWCTILVKCKENFDYTSSYLQGVLLGNKDSVKDHTKDDNAIGLDDGSKLGLLIATSEDGEDRCKLSADNGSLDWALGWPTSTPDDAEDGCDGSLIE